MQWSASRVRGLLLAAACISLMAGCRDGDDDDPAVVGQHIIEPIPPPEPDHDPDPEPEPKPPPQPSGWTGTNRDIALFHVTAVDPDHAWASSGGGLGIHATTDGGVTWSVIADSRSHIQFVDTQHGWALGGPYIQSSSDGGATWTYRLELSSYQTSSISFIDPDTG
jgi:hypothetical protein